MIRTRLFMLPIRKIFLFVSLVCAMSLCAVFSSASAGLASSRPHPPHRIPALITTNLYRHGKLAGHMALTLQETATNTARGAARSSIRPFNVTSPNPLYHGGQVMRPPLAHPLFSESPGTPALPP